MRLLHPFLIAFCLFVLPVTAQKPLEEFCNSTGMMEKWLRSPVNRSLHEQVEQQLLAFKRSGTSLQRPNSVITLSVVVHIIHNNGPENISDVQVLQGIQHLNQAFANIGPYDPNDGVDCQIQFCLAKRDPAGNVTNGITRNVSALTNMNMDTDDISVKDINRWNPLCYINIWLVNEICSNNGCGVGGYAYYPSAHGLNMDGIVMEARWFGSSPVSSGVQVHEMGHYLGLYHTFEGGCTNNDCLVDGDRVCDTPPDASTVSIPCSNTMNSCSTDTQSGFTTDQDDLTRDYMDYGSLNCYSIFTQGQADRMNWHIINVRSSLLNCLSCFDPCPAPVIANCTTPGATLPAGSSFTFTNLSVNASSYEWYVNNTLLSTSAGFSYTFPAIGSYTIKLVAISSDPLCLPDSKIFTVNAVCPVTASFTKSASIAASGTNINFTNTSSGATGYQWLVNNVVQSTSVNFSYTNNVAGRYEIKLVARNAAFNCVQQMIDTVEYTCPATAAFTPNGGSININTPVGFTNASTGATSYQWLVNGALVSTTTNFTYSFTTPGNNSVLLTASNGACATTHIVYFTAIDTCLRQAFQKSYGQPDADEIINDIAYTPDGGYIACGSSGTVVNGQTDAWLAKFDHTGSLQWSRVYGGAAGDVFYRVKLLNGGGYIAVGETKSFGTTGDVLAIRTDADGNIVWAKRFGENVGLGESGTDVIQTAGGFVICGRQAFATPASDLSNAVLIRLDDNGNPQWARVYNASLFDDATSVIEENNSYTVTGKVKSANTNVYLMKVSKTDGSVMTANSYNLNNKPGNAYQLVKTGSNYELSFYISPLSDADYPQPVAGTLRLDDLGAIVHAKYLKTAGNHTGGIMIPTPDGGYTAVVYDRITAILQIYKFGSQLNQQWGNSFPQTNLPFISRFIVSGDGGYMAGGVVNSLPSMQKDAFLLKTDNAGTTPGCTNNFLSATLPDVTVTPESVNFVSRAHNTTSPNANIVTADRMLPGTSLCSGTSCAEVEDTCSITTFQKSLGTAGTDNITDIKNIPGGGYVASGITNTTPTNIDAVVIKLDSKGDMIWNKVLQGSNTDHLHRIIATSDGGFLGGGYVLSTNSVAWMVKLDALGNMQWTREYTDGSAVGSIIYDICETSDGGYAFAGSFFADAMVGKTDASGNISWCKRFNGTLNDQAWSIFEDNGQLIVSGVGSALAGGPFFDGFFMKLNPADGSVVFSRAYDIDNRNNVFRNMKKMNDGQYLVDCRNYNDYTGANYVFVSLLIDSVSGSVNKIMNHNLSSSLGYTDATTVTSDNGFMLVQSDGDDNDIHFRKINATGNLQVTKKYGDPALNEVIMSIVEAPDKGLFGGGFVDGPNGRDFLFLKTGSNGNMACPVSPDTGNITTPPFLTGTFNWSAVTNINILANNPGDHVATSMTFTPHTYCFSTADCSLLDIAGADSVCNMQDTITYQARRSPGCAQAVQWSVTPAGNAVITGTSDSTIKIKFLVPGFIRLQGHLENNCSPSLDDTLDIEVFNNPRLNLGPDVSLCSGSTISFHAGPGFKTYRWQDGQTDSVYTAYQPGTYWVETEDFCGSIARDTVVISLAAPVPFDLGPGLQRCNNDTLTITAPAGFTSYTWAANYNINTTSGRTVRIWPAVDTLYTVVAESSPGCQVIDTIRVTLAASPVVTLGNDTSFCAGNSVTLTPSPGLGWTSYLWQNGSTASAFTATTTGLYWVEVRNGANSCVSRDSMRVLNNYPQPPVNLGRDTLLCNTTSLVLNAGNGFAAYLWQDGSTNSTFTASAAGNYWVRIRDANGCINSDTLSIIAIGATPVNFITPRIGMCLYEPVYAHGVHGYRNYLWSTGVSADSALIVRPGIYWLQVTTNEGCSARADFEVFDKNCPQNIYFPTAFSPNHDGTNDVYRPKAFAIIKEYRLDIYNRFGERVFFTTDISKGWDGSVKGKMQGTGTYIWQCHYQLKDQEPVFKKGTMVLVR